MQIKKLRQEQHRKPVNAAKCLEQLAQLKERYADFIHDNKSFEDALEQLRKCLFETEVMPSKANVARGREAFRAAMMLLEELAEERQRIYDDIIPNISGMEAVRRSLKDFDMKRDFETSLSALH